MKTYIAALVWILAPLAAQTYRVSGTVVDSESGSPLNRTRVALSGGPILEQSVITTSTGTFSFNVPQGKYTLTAAHRDYGESYGQSRSGDADSSIVTGLGLDTTGIVMRWHAPIAIHGKVMDQSGEPVHDAKLELFIELVTGGKKRVISIGRAESDESGNYSWSSLPAGTYYLAATGEPWYFSDPGAKDGLTDAGNPPRPYALTYFPSGSDPRGATPLTLDPGAHLQADFTLRPATGTDLHFTCPNSACAGSLTVSAVGIGGGETVLTDVYAAESNLISAVPPGRYMIRYSGSDEGMRKEIEVTGGDMTVEITPKPLPTLTGRVTLENPRQQPQHPVQVNLLDEETGKAVTVALNANGSFSFPSPPVSRLRLLLSGGDGVFITRMSVEGASVKDGLIEVVDGAAVKVDLTAGAKNGSLNGFVVNGDKPVPMVMVVLVPASSSANPNGPYGFQTDSDGSFDFTAVPAGDYVLFAVDDREFEYANPAVLRPYLTTGKRISIEPQAIRTERIEVSLKGPN
jgi:hypothetical protein